MVNPLHGRLLPSSTCPHQCHAQRYSFIPYGYNFGDAVGEPLLEYAAGGRSLCSGPALAQSAGHRGPTTRRIVMGLGSVLHHILGKQVLKQIETASEGVVTLWGTGHVGVPLFFNPADLRAWPYALDVRATRGFLTRSFIATTFRNHTVHSFGSQATVGDPALLLPLMLPNCARLCKPARAVCLVPHHGDQDYVLQHASSLPTRVFVETTNTSWPAMLDWILGCGMVLSSSLHGLIFAEAFGVPARWLQLRDYKGQKGHLKESAAVSEGWFKYVDYYTATRPAVAKAYGALNIENLLTLLEGKGELASAPPLSLSSFGLEPATSLAEGLRLGGSPGIADGDFDSRQLLRAFPTELTDGCPQPWHAEATAAKASTEWRAEVAEGTTSASIAVVGRGSRCVEMQSAACVEALKRAT